MLKRRNFLGLSAVLGLASGTGIAKSAVTESGRKIPKQPGKQTFVLVHGAWHGGWCWRDVSRRLTDLGHHVYTPTMTGLGERVHLNSREVNLTTHVTDIVNLIKFEELNDVILVGHSYAGYVVSMVADAVKDRIGQIIYLDAALPEEGKAFVPEATKSSLTKKYESDFVLPASGLAFLGIAEDHPKAPWVKRHLRPHPLGCFLENVSFQNDGPAGLPKTFIRCTGNPRYKNGDPVKLMTNGDREWSYEIIDTGHDAMVTEPVKLADMLHKMANLHKAG